VGGPANLQVGAIFFLKAEKQENKEIRGARIFAGGPGPRGPPRRYGAGL